MAGKNRGPGRRWPAGADLERAEHHLQVAERDSFSNIYANLRHMILYNEIEPGAWLRQTDLATTFEVSRTPIREALRALEQEGLVKIVPYHGAQVTELSLETFEEIYALRIGIEGLAARKAAEAASDEDKRQLQQHLESLASMVGNSPIEMYIQNEWQLRLRCYQLTNRPGLLSTITFLRESAERYLQLAYRSEEQTGESYQFHERLIEAISRNDGIAAERINQAALRWTLKRVAPLVEGKTV